MRQEAQRKSHSFRSVFRSAFFKVTALGITLFAIVDLGFFALSSLRLRSEIENKIVTVVQSSLREPLSQGSFAEANNRFAKLRSDNAFSCGSVSIWDFSSDLCAGVAPSFFTRVIEAPIFSDRDLSEISGHLILRFDRTDLVKEVSTRLAAGVLLFALFGLWVVRILNSTGKTIEDELATLIEASRARVVSGNQIANPDLKITEFSELFTRLSEIMQKLEVTVRQSATTEVAKQMAHDIRSPLSALSVALQDLGDVGSDNRRLATMAVDRIRKIADDLLVKSKAAVADVFEVNEAVQEIVLEKQSIVGARIEVTLNFEGESFKVNSPKVEFQRVISNLLNNSIEAMPHGGKIAVFVRKQNQMVAISIHDTGKGIPKEVLAKVGQPGFTYGKEDSANAGSGLGVSHALKCLKEWGGNLTITSEAGKGTLVTAVLPLQPGVISL